MINTKFKVGDKVRINLDSETPTVGVIKNIIDDVIAEIICHHVANPSVTWHASCYTTTLTLIEPVKETEIEELPEQYFYYAVLKNKNTTRKYSSFDELIECLKVLGDIDKPETEIYKTRKIKFKKIVTYKEVS